MRHLHQNHHFFFDQPLISYQNQSQLDKTYKKPYVLLQLLRELSLIAFIFILHYLLLYHPPTVYQT